MSRPWREPTRKRASTPPVQTAGLATPRESGAQELRLPALPSVTARQTREKGHKSSIFTRWPCKLNIRCSTIRFLRQPLLLARLNRQSSLAPLPRLRRRPGVSAVGSVCLSVECALIARTPDGAEPGGLGDGLNPKSSNPGACRSEFSQRVEICSALVALVRVMSYESGGAEGRRKRRGFECRRARW